MLQFMASEVLVLKWLEAGLLPALVRWLWSIMQDQSYSPHSSQGVREERKERRRKSTLQMHTQ